VPKGQRGQGGAQSLEAENAHLKARLAKAIEVFRAQEAKYARLAAAYEEERKARIDHEQSVEHWRTSWRRMTAKAEDLEDQLKKAGIEPRLNYQWLDRGPTLEDVLKQLLAMAHPDKWSQAQPATALAHDLAVAINRLREQGHA
jgi:hypothetical protein